jgi:hypothetical protein
VAGADGVAEGPADRDGLGEALDLDGDGETDGLALAVAEGNAEDGRTDAEAVDGDADAAVVVASGTAGRTSRGAASSRDGDSYANSPLANPAAATTATTAPAVASRAVRRRMRLGCGACVVEPGAEEFPSASNRFRSVGLGVAGGRVSERSGIVASDAGTRCTGAVSSSSSTYGRMRSGSKSSAAAASAVRASRRASDARWVHPQDGVLSAPLGAPHSGHR